MRRTAMIAAGWLAYAVLAAAAVPPSHQSPPTASPQNPPVFRAGVNLVKLDVSVLDKNRQPVKGLAQADFTILEDGKPQAIEAFATVELPDVVPAAATWMTDVTPDVTTNDVTDQRMFVIVMDDGNGDLWAQRAAKTAAESFVDRLGPRDVAALVFTGPASRVGQDLTSDHAKLKRAIGSSTGGANPCQVARILLDITDTLRDGGVADRRKGLVYIGGGLPPPILPDCPIDMADVYRAAQQANVNLYPIDSMGLRPFSIAGGARPQPGFKAEDNYLAAAANTGGKAIVLSNDFEPGLTQIFAENTSYYLLAYRPTNVKEDGTYRKLDVKVDRSDVEVRTRSRYIAPKALPRSSAKNTALPPSPDVAALSDILPKPDVPLRISLAPFAVPGKQTAAIAVALGVRTPALVTRTTEEARLLVRAFTPDGTPSGNADQPITLNLTPARRGSEFSRYDLLAQLDLKPGRYELRVSAHSTTLDKLGSVYADVEVPDFAREPVSLSGVLISLTPGVPVAPSEALGAIVPVLPTTERTFARTDRVSAFLRVYQGGGGKLAPVPVAIRILDAHDQAAFEQTDALGADAFGKARAADERYALPLARLAPGEHLITFEATLDKTTARRDVRFSVK